MYIKMAASSGHHLTKERTSWLEKIDMWLNFLQVGYEAYNISAVVLEKYLQKLPRVRVW